MSTARDGGGPPLLAIIAGGASTRMGRDKAALEIAGATLLERLIASGRALGVEVLVVGRAAPPHQQRAGVRFVPDEQPGQGPLGGLVTALAHAPLVAAVACDLPGLDDAGLRWLLGLAGLRGEADGVATVTPAGIEPLFSLYAGRCLAAARARLASGQRALHRFIAAGDFVRVDAPPWLLPRLANVNTPEDWQRFASGPSDPPA